MDQHVAHKIDEFFGTYKLRQLQKGQILIYADDPVEYVYHLVSGCVKQYDISYRGEEIVLNIFKPPAFFPMSQAMTNTPSRYFFEVEEDIEFYQAPAQEVISFIKDNPDVLYDLLKRVYQGVDGLIGRMAHLMTSNAKSRLTYELIIQARRFSKPRPDGSYEVHLSEKDLGARTGLSRETVNREIRKLKKASLITVGRNTVTIPDLVALEAQLHKEH